MAAADGDVMAYRRVVLDTSTFEAIGEARPCGGRGTSAGACGRGSLGCDLWSSVCLAQLLFFWCACLCFLIFGTHLALGAYGASEPICVRFFVFSRLF